MEAARRACSAVLSMVTHGTVQYSLFRLQKYSRMQEQEPDGVKEEPSAEHTSQVGCGPSTRTVVHASQRWGHVSVQPLWCRVATVTNEDAPNTHLSVEWGPFTRTITSGLASTKDGDPSANKSYTVLVGCKLTKESLNLSSNTWHPKYEGGDVQRPARAQFTFKAIYQGSRVGFRCRHPEMQIDKAGPVGTQACSRRFQLHFISAEEATSFLQCIQVGGPLMQHECPCIPAAEPISSPSPPRQAHLPVDDSRPPLPGPSRESKLECDHEWKSTRSSHRWRPNTPQTAHRTARAYRRDPSVQPIHAPRYCTRLHTRFCPEDLDSASGVFIELTK